MAKKPSGPQKELSAAMRIVVLHGKEAFLRAQMTGDLRELLAKHFGGVDLLTFNGEQAAAADVLDECRSFGLIAQHKLVVVDEAEELVKEDTRTLFERYAEAPCEGATLVLRASTWRSGKLDKLIEKVGAIIACESPSDAEAKNWVVAQAKSAHKATIDKDAANLLVIRVGPELGKLDNELGKLAAAAGESGKITAALVEQFVGASREEEVWNIQSSLLNSGPEEALEHLRYVLDVSRQPAPLALYALTDLARKIHGASRALRGGAQPGQLIRPLKLWGASIDGILGAAKRTSPDQALQLLRECVQGDSRSKSGLGEVERTLERLVVRFAQVLGTAPAPA